MEIIAHRINTLDALSRLAPELGAEIDIRSRGGRLILHHEPHAEGPLFSDFAALYARTRRERLLILNTKEDGLDKEILAILAQNGLKRFFFLDLSLPSAVRLALRQNEGRLALRVSEYEPAESLGPFKGRAQWAWLDCFEGRPPSAKTARELRKDFKVCLVSPELEGYPKESIALFKPLAAHADAVCTKHPELWR
jgi:hypothetical protein